MFFTGLMLLFHLTLGDMTLNRAGVGGVLFFGLLVLIYLGGGGMAIVAMIIGIKKERARVAQEEPIWKKAVQRWQCLYYCFRDDLVFDPQTGETCQPDSLTEFLHSAS